jgi:hypothetical protein
MSIKETLIERVNDVRLGMNSLQSSDFGDVFFWQEVSSYADKQHEAAWKELQAPEKGRPKIKTDDELRALGEGPHSLKTTKLFNVQIQVAKASSTLTKEGFDAFLAELCHKYKILDTKAVLGLVEKHKKAGGKARLTKRVVENVRE